MDYTTWMKVNGARERTIHQREKFRCSRLREWGTLDVPADQIKRWLSQYDGWTRCTYYGHLVSLYDWAVEVGEIPTNLARTITRPRSPKPRPRPLTRDEINLALGSATGDLRTHLQLGLLAGLRAHEIAKFAGADITESGIYVIGKGGQGAMLPTHPDLWAVAQNYPRHGYWFPSERTETGHILPNTVSRRVTAHFRELGIAGSSHRNRHGYGTLLLRGGANLRVVQELMRHATLNTTALYLGVDEDEKVAAIRGLVA
ncbi:tyrosine-type recombinase/integrase [Nocardioides sp. T2.26MG-1]|uniref:tyrosine-type recombinase/integrase n=1 Tax=Nocardioides sp. T2.26MG-1 TaxID=3041166 RepID=UPI0024778568|nr:tyrosine-type recombinase/integrase [Nocardioides sp. T2.26MG-1]CAI9417467.1 Tyrosine recombinase XerC [Nocardioides sp. T2.26MG-1]